MCGTGPDDLTLRTGSRAFVDKLTSSCCHRSLLIWASKGPELRYRYTLLNSQHIRFISVSNLLQLVSTSMKHAASGCSPQTSRKCAISLLVLTKIKR